MPASSVDVPESNEQPRLVQLAVNRATGAWFAGADPMSIVFVTLFESPPASVTVSVTFRGPLCGYVAVTVGPVAELPGYLLRSQLYETMPLSSVELRPSKVQMVPLHDAVNRATGATFGAGGGRGSADERHVQQPIRRSRADARQLAGDGVARERARDRGRRGTRVPLEIQRGRARDVRRGHRRAAQRRGLGVASTVRRADPFARGEQIDAATPVGERRARVGRWWTRRW